MSKLLIDRVRNAQKQVPLGKKITENYAKSKKLLAGMSGKAKEVDNAMGGWIQKIWHMIKSPWAIFMTMLVFTIKMFNSRNF